MEFESEFNFLKIEKSVQYVDLEWSLVDSNDSFDAIWIRKIAATEQDIEKLRKSRIMLAELRGMRSAAWICLIGIPFGILIGQLFAMMLK